MKNNDPSGRAALFLKLARIKFLLYSPILYTLGIAMLQKGGNDINLSRYLIGLVFVWNTHIMTHLFNEYYDIDADRCNANPSPWTGGSRVLVEGAVSPATCLRLGYISMLISTSMAFLFFSGGTLLIAILMILACYSYSAPPLRLEARGLGELTVIIVLNLLLPFLGLALQGSTFYQRHFSLLLVPLMMIGFVRMMVMNIADREGDRMAGKRTLVVRIGAGKASLAYLAGQATCYTLVAVLRMTDYISRAQFAWIIATLPFGLWVAYRLCRGDWKTSEGMHTIPFLASTHNALAACSVLVGLIISKSTWHYGDICFYPIYLFLSAFVYMQLRIHLSRFLRSRTMRNITQ